MESLKSWARKVRRKLLKSLTFLFANHGEEKDKKEKEVEKKKVIIEDIPLLQTETEQECFQYYKFTYINLSSTHQASICTIKVLWPLPLLLGSGCMHWGPAKTSQLCNTGADRWEESSVRRSWKKPSWGLLLFHMELCWSSGSCSFRLLLLALAQAVF